MLIHLKKAVCYTIVLLLMVSSVVVANAEYVSTYKGFSVGEIVRLVGRYTASSDGSGTTYGGLYSEYKIAKILSGAKNPFALQPVNKSWIDGWASASAIEHITPTQVDVTGVSVKPTSLTLSIGKTAKLIASVLPSNATNTKIAWSSSDSTVASVDGSGQVNAKKDGKATIIAKSHNGKKASCEVTVKQSTPTIKTTDVIISPLNIFGKTLGIGRTMTFTATVLPSNATDKSVTWKSSNTKAATIDAKGILTGKAEGTTYVTATTNDTKMVSWKVKVTVKPVEVSMVVINNAPAVLGVNETVQLKADLSPADATKKTVKWSSSNKSIASVDSKGNVNGLKEGTVKITCTAQDESNKKATVSITVKFIDVTGLVLNKASGTIFKGNTIQLKATVSPANASDKSLKWTSSNSDVASVSSKGLVSGKKKGTAVITAQSVSGGKNATFKVTVDDMFNHESMFIKQANTSTCTLAAATMMLRRKAYLLGHTSYLDITESAVRPFAWGSDGLKGSFSYTSQGKKMTVGVYQPKKNVWSITKLSRNDKKKLFIELLKKHPEGIVIYQFRKPDVSPHAVLLTGYSTSSGVFYVADPAKSAGKGIIKLSDASLLGKTQDETIDNLDKIWYITSVK